ncbi:MAG: phosphotransferase [Planctomycetes bacterium]|nr:phosphotransferase [Planctomycetota bacterium]
MTKPVFDVSFILSRYPEDCQPLHVEPLGSAGGMSGAVFWRITARRGLLALRQWPAEHPTANRLHFIHAVLQHAAARGIQFLPVPIATSDRHSFVLHGGHLWELAKWMPGAADYLQTPNPTKLQRTFTALARFHVATADFDRGRAGVLGVGHLADPAPQATASPVLGIGIGASPGIARRLAALRGLSSDETARLSRAIHETAWPELVPLARSFVVSLPRVLPAAIACLVPLASVPLPLQPCLRDVWHDHVLFVGDEVSGIIDFGAMSIDAPAGDVARLLGSLTRNDTEAWQTGLDAYGAVRPLSADELRAVTAFDMSGMVLAGCNWIRWIYLEDRQFENHSQVVERFRQIVSRCELVFGM